MKVLHKSDYRKRRVAEYDPLSDQIDRITKALEYLHVSGVDIGPDGVEQVEHVAAIKNKFSKNKSTHI